MSSQIIKQINALIQDNHFEEAQAVIGRVALVQVSDPAVLLELGKLSFLMADLKEAEKHLRASLELDKGNYDSYYQLGLVLLKQGNTDLAMPAFREACELKPDFALGHLYWGITLLSMSNIKGALGQFKLATKIDQSLFSATYYAGLAHLRLNENEEAIRYFEQTISQEPDFAPAQNALGVAYINTGKIDDAITCFKRACKLRPDFSSANLNLADILAKLGKYDAAQTHYRAVLNNPDLSASQRAVVYNNLAVTFGQLKQWEMASEYLSQAQSVAPQMVEIQVNLGLVLVALREYDLAISNFEHILRSYPDQFEANFYGGMALLSLRKYQQAQNLLAQASACMANSNPAENVYCQQLFLWYGYSGLANKLYDQAKEQLDKIVLLDMKANKTVLCLAFDALGVRAALLDQQSEAIEYFDKCLSLDANLALAYVHRARSYEATGDEAAASRDYQKALQLDASCLDTDKDYIIQLLDNAKVEEAMAQATKMLTLKPQDIESRLLMAKTLQKKNAYSEAINLLNAILKDAPTNGAAYTMLGQIHMSQGDFAQADEIFLKASKLDNVEAELFLSWARSLAYLGFHELALEKFKQAADINPYDADIYESWAQALKSLGRFNEASEVYRLASSYL